MKLKEKAEEIERISRLVRSYRIKVKKRLSNYQLLIKEIEAETKKHTTEIIKKECEVKGIKQEFIYKLLKND